MRRRRKTTIVLGILGVGLFGSIPFFRPATKPPVAPHRTSGDELALRGVPLQVVGQPGHSPAVGLYDDDPLPRAASGSGEGGPHSPAGLDQFGPPPEFTTSYPSALEPVAPLSGRPEEAFSRAKPGIRPASAEADLSRRHRIIDGDTLARLARKYLGDAGRAGEIFEANRDVLTTPAVLPLGVEIVIPLESHRDRLGER